MSALFKKQNKNKLGMFDDIKFDYFSSLGLGFHGWLLTRLDFTSYLQFWYDYCGLHCSQ